MAEPKKIQEEEYKGQYQLELFRHKETTSFLEFQEKYYSKLKKQQNQLQLIDAKDLSFLNEDQIKQFKQSQQTMNIQELTNCNLTIDGISIALNVDKETLNQINTQANFIGGVAYLIEAQKQFRREFKSSLDIFNIKIIKYGQQTLLLQQNVEEKNQKIQAMEIKNLNDMKKLKQNVELTKENIQEFKDYQENATSALKKVNNQMQEIKKNVEKGVGGINMFQAQVKGLIDKQLNQIFQKQQILHQTQSSLKYNNYVKNQIEKKLKKLEEKQIQEKTNLRDLDHGIFDSKGQIGSKEAQIQYFEKVKQYHDKNILDAEFEISELKMIQDNLELRQQQYDNEYKQLVQQLKIENNRLKAAQHQLQEEKKQENLLITTKNNRTWVVNGLSAIKGLLFQNLNDEIRNSCTYIKNQESQIEFLVQQREQSKYNYESTVGVELNKVKQEIQEKRSNIQEYNLQKQQAQQLKLNLDENVCNVQEEIEKFKADFNKKQSDKSNIEKEIFTNQKELEQIVKKIEQQNAKILVQIQEKKNLKKQLYDLGLKAKQISRLYIPQKTIDYYNEANAYFVKFEEELFKSNEMIQNDETELDDIMTKIQQQMNKPKFTDPSEDKDNYYTTEAQEEVKQTQKDLFKRFNQVMNSLPTQMIESQQRLNDAQKLIMQHYQEKMQLLNNQ